MSSTAQRNLSPGRQFTIPSCPQQVPFSIQSPNPVAQLTPNSHPPYLYIGTVSGHIVLIDLLAISSPTLLLLPFSLPPSPFIGIFQENNTEKGDLRSTTINHQIRPRDVAAEAARQEARHTSDFCGKTRALKTDVCALGLLLGGGDQFEARGGRSN